ncbi:MAG: hypothetical protein ABJM06_01035 [Gilvibacter sp.]
MTQNYFEHKEGFCFVNDQEIRFTKTASTNDLRKKESILAYYWEIIFDFGPPITFMALAIDSLIDSNYFYAVLWFIASMAFGYRYLVTSTSTQPQLLKLEEISEVNYGITKFGNKRGNFEIKYKEGKHKLHCDIIMPHFSDNGAQEIEKARLLFRQNLPEEVCLF